jgi:predicted nucleotidyltransferase
MLNHRCGRGPSLMGQRPKGMARYAMVDYEAFIQELEVAGVDEVRARVLNNQYSKVSPKREIAQDWLNRKEMKHQRERQARADEIALRASSAAERAADAAKEQAKQAQQANRIAATALVIAVAAAIMSLIALAKKIT